MFVGSFIDRLTQGFDLAVISVDALDIGCVVPVRVRIETTPLTDLRVLSLSVHVCAAMAETRTALERGHPSEEFDA